MRSAWGELVGGGDVTGLDRDGDEHPVGVAVGEEEGARVRRSSRRNRSPHTCSG